MKPRRFVRNVFFPAFIPLLAIAAGRYIPLPFSFKLLTTVLLISSALIYLKRLNQLWGYPGDMQHEIRRLRNLIFLVLLNLPLELGFFFTISSIPDRTALFWPYLLTGTFTFFMLLTLGLQLIRFSPEVRLGSFRLMFGLLLTIIIILTGWSGQLQFVVFFLLAIWMLKFEGCDDLKFGRRLGITLICLFGLIILTIAGSSTNPADAEQTSDIILGNITVTARTVNSLYILKNSLVPAFPNILNGIRNIVIALLIVLPGKALLRPLAEWLKIALRIRTKLVLSYVFSSVIPAILLVIVLLFGVLFMMGAFWQQFMNGMIVSRTDALTAMWNSSLKSQQQFYSAAPVLSEQHISDYLRNNGISVVFADRSAGGTLELERVGGASLPGLSAGDSLTIDLLNEIFVDPQTNRIYHRQRSMPVLRIPGVAVLEEIGNDSLIAKLAEKNFSGLSWFAETPYLTRWMLRNNTVVGLFQPFTSSDLQSMKERCGSDLKVILLSDMEINEYSPGGVSVQIDGSLKPVMQTRVGDRGVEFPNIPISFPALMTSLSWMPGEGFIESNSIMMVETSLFSVFGVLFTTENFVNRIYIAVFAVLAGFFGIILILISLIGFSLAGGITRSISKLRKATQQLREGDLSVRINIKSRDELGELAESFNLMVTDINRMLEEVGEKERLVGELESAKAIQMKLLPQAVPQLSGYQIAATSLPAKQVGGDYFDFIELPNKHLGLAIGDVSGKGMPAALLMANLQASLRALAQANLTPEILVERLNIVLHGNTAPHMFATFFFASLDPDINHISYVNAGHNYPVVCGNGKPEFLTTGGLILGVSPAGKYRSSGRVLEPGEIMALYSDGISEACNDRGEEFGDERLVELIQDYAAEEADAIMRNVLREVSDYCGSPQDDVTLMIVKRL